MRKVIVITTSFEAIHHWPDCPIEEVSFLKNPHRHIFHVTAKFTVSHNNRDIEFIAKKREVEQYVDVHFRSKNLGALSCEDIAEALFSTFNASFISVYEDNENGSEIYEN